MRALPVNPIPHIQVMIDIDTVAEREGWGQPLSTLKLELFDYGKEP